MAFVLLVAVLALFGFSANASSGGMTSSGGELIVSEDNPWFVGERAVSYCVLRPSDTRNIGNMTLSRCRG